MDISHPTTPSPLSSIQFGYPSGLYEKIFYTALLLHPIHIGCAFTNGLAHCGWMGVALMGTSLNYWRRPDMASIRRTVDMIVAKFSILYHVWLSTYTKNSYFTTLPMVFGILCYMCSLYLHNKGEYEIASNLHVALHVLMSIGACMTYMELSNTWGVEDTGVLLGLV